VTIVSGADGIDAKHFLTVPTVSLDGTALTGDQMANLLRLEVESVVGRPDLCEIEFIQRMDSQGTPSDDVPAGWKPGVAVKVKFDTDVLFDGEITSIDFSGGANESTRTVMVAYDKRHRLYRHEETKVFLNVTWKDVIDGLLGSMGIQGTYEGLPTAVMKHYLHQGTVGDLVDWLCAQYGLASIWDSGFKIKPLSSVTTVVGPLRPTVHVYEYRLRQTTSSDLAKTTVMGWDPKQKKAIVGEASRADASGVLAAPTKASTAFNLSSAVVAAPFTVSDNDATKLATAIGAQNVDAAMQLDASCIILPKARAGSLLELEGTPTRFEGRYRISAVRHLFDAAEGGRTQLTCRGGDDTTVLGILGQAVDGGATSGPDTRDLGVRPAIVTKVNAAEGSGKSDLPHAGEVKVKMPWLGDTVESDWLRVVMVGAGKERGFYVMPEVDDEVLVAFEQGDPRRGYVLGGLYNGKDSPKQPLNKAVVSNKVEQRAFTTRIGSRLLFDDSKGAEVVELAAGTDKFVMRFEEGKGLTVTNKTTGNVITMTADGDITVESKTGGLTLKAQKDVVIESATGKISMKASAGDVSADAMNVKLNGTVGAEVKAAKVDITSQGPATVKGNPIMLN
jgi:uncharacterized protein involved in type VI secretion and phage assembly